MVEPEHLTRFWGPVGMTAPIEAIKVDPRPGGVFETTMVNDADGSEYTSRGIFVEVVEPEKLVWTDTDWGMTSTTTFEDLGDGRTEVCIVQSNVPEMFRSAVAQSGFATSLDRFVRYIAGL